MNKVFLVYYTQLPSELDKMVQSDRHITLSKDGIRYLNGNPFPRLCLKIKSVSPGEDKDRERKVANLLQYLKDGRQIIDFSKQG